MRRLQKGTFYIPGLIFFPWKPALNIFQAAPAIHLSACRQRAFRILNSLGKLAVWKDGPLRRRGNVAVGG